MATSNTQRIDSFEIEELAADICGVEDYDDISDILYEKHEIDYEQFEKIVQLLFDRINVGVSPLTNEVYIGFTSKEHPVWMAKKEYTSEFIGYVIQWATEHTPLKPGEGFEKEITSEGEVEYTIQIRKPGTEQPKETT